MSKIKNKRADIAGICSETQVCNHFKTTPNFYVIITY